MSAVSRMKTQLDLRPADEAAAKIKDFVGPEGRDENPKHVGIGLQVPVSDVQIVCHVIMVVLAILGNATVIVVIGKSVIQDRRVAHNSNIIIINMAVSNLMVSIMRNILLIVSDFGIQVCKIWIYCPLNIFKKGMHYFMCSQYFMQKIFI